MSDADLYREREQTLVKHLMLRLYLRDFAHKIASRWNTIVYVDCFSGPWQARSEDFADTSFGIAIQELRRVRETYAGQDRQISLRCFFVEEAPSAHERLHHFASAISDIEIKTRNGTLEESIDAIVQFIRASPDAFPFIFIDPTGWTGFALDAITPLLRLKPGEVLINFMTGHIRRFIDSPDEPTRESFERLFGSTEFRAALKGRSGLDREDAAVRRYMEAVKSAGNFGFSSVAMVLHPEIDRSHFHLVYLTRNSAGVKVFKAAERSSMRQMEQARAEAQQRKRVKKSGARELFPAPEVHDQSHFNELRAHFLTRAGQELLSRLQTQKRLSYDEVWAQALENPLVWESDLKEWIRGWRKAQLLSIDGMKPKEREPKLNNNNILVWQGGSDST